MYEVSSCEQLGRVIAFWSPIHRQGATSTTAAFIAAYLSEDLEENDKILVMSNELFGSMTAGDYLTTESLGDGLTEIIELSRCRNLNTCEDIYNNTYSEVDNIDIVANSKRSTSLRDSDIEKEIESILNIARAGYKYIIVDCVAGKHSQSTMTILRCSDVRVVCMPQDRYIIDSWIRGMPNVYLQDFNDKPTIIVLEQYYNYKHLKYERLCKEFHNERLAYIDLSDTVSLAISKRKVKEMLREIIKQNDELIPQIKFITNQIEDMIQTVINKEIEEAERADEEERISNEEYKEKLLMFNMGYDNASSNINESSTSSNDTYKDRVEGYTVEISKSDNVYVDSSTDDTGVIDEDGYEIETDEDGYVPGMM